MPPSRGTPRPMAREVVHIYIDNSNLWIQGQRTYAEKKRMSVPLDPTWRFDVGRLRQVIIEGLGGDDPSHFDVRTNLYGSTPPPVDSIWVAISSQDVLVKKFERSSWTGKEKCIDAEIIADSVTQAGDDERDAVVSTFVFVSGDLDISRAVAKITGRFRRPVHVWSWRNGLAAAYRKPQESVTVHLMDDHLERVGFSAVHFNVDRSTIHGHSIVVHDPLPHADVIERHINSIPFPLYKYEDLAQRPGASSKDLILIPVSPKGMDPAVLEGLFQTVKGKLEPYGMTVMTFMGHAQQKSPTDTKQGLAVSNQFKELPVDKEGPEEMDEADEIFPERTAKMPRGTFGVEDYWPRRLLDTSEWISYEKDISSTTPRYGARTSPAYNIISYIWGRYRAKGDETGTAVEVGGIPWSVPSISTERGFSSEVFKGALKQAGKDAEFLWVDIACIPQSPYAIDALKEEANEEIGHQAAIFHRAKRAFIWLHTLSTRDVTDGLNDLAHRRWDGEAGACLLKDPWFTSLWTLQEAFLRKDAILLSNEGETASV